MARALKMKQPRMPPALAITPMVTPRESLPEAAATIFGVQVFAK